MNNELAQGTRPSNLSESYFAPLAIIGGLFFIFGFFTWLNGSLVPFLKIICELGEFQALFVTFAFYIAYTVMALPAAIVLKKTGYKNGLIIGLVIMALGSLAFIPAAKIQTYIIFLAALFLVGTGLTLLQTAANPYIVCTGPRESAATRISIMGLINKGAGVVVPIAFTAVVMNGMDKFDADALAALTGAEREAVLSDLSSRLVTPYIYLAGVLLAFAAVVKITPLPEPVLDDSGANEDVNEKEILKYPQAILGALALFTYVGVEVIAGDTIGLYGQNLGVANFASLTSYTMSFMVIGYIIGVVCIPKYLSQEKALLGSAVFGIIFVLGVMFGSEESTVMASALFGWSGIPVVPDSIMFLALLGLANALVWPAIWPLALQDLGKFTAVGSALLIMGIAGGAIIPLAYGHFAENGDAQVAYWVMIPCYIFILFYAIKGHKMRSWK